ncbi:MAG: hypothetical protein K2I78_04510, partial [Clostridia bacterium]|nr:hypothetical protein [Clostridia bacterium]
MVFTSNKASDGTIGTKWQYQYYAANIFGYFNSKAGDGKAYDQADDAGRKLMDTFNSYGIAHNGSFGNNVPEVVLNNENMIPDGNHEYRTKSTNLAYGLKFRKNSGNDMNSTGTIYMQGSTPKVNGDFTYRTTTFSNEDKANARLMLFSTRYQDNWASNFVSDFTAMENGATVSFGSSEWYPHPNGEGGTTNTSGKNTTFNYSNDMTINIHVYDKNALATAINNLQKSVDELTNLAVATGGEGVNSIAAANELIRQGTEILNVRKVNAERVQDLTDAMNNFVFDVVRPATSFTSWTFGERDNGGKTFLNTLWSQYNGENAKYFNVNINHKIYGEFGTGEPENINRPLVSDKDTYDSYAYVQDAGDYVIRFTPKDPSTFNSGILHGVRWLSTSDQSTAEMTLTIDRATMDVYPAAVADRPYTGAAQQFAMTTDGSVVSLKGGMKSENAELVVKLLKYDPGADNSPDWDSAAENQIEFTEVGEHKVYYRIQAKNHLRYLGEYYVKIVPGNVTITFGAQSIDENASGGVLTYGDAVLSSEDIIAQGVTGVKLNGVDSDVVNKDTLKNILTIGLYVNNAFVTDNLTAAGNHGVRVKDFMSVTQSAVEQEENSDINSWSQRINVALVDESSCYKIAKKEINIVWGELAEQVYNGLGNHRPTADVKAGDEVVGGERFAITTYILKGEEVGLSGDNAGRITVDGIEYEVPLTTGGNAIWAGEYKVGVRNREDSNYTVIESSRTTDFKIKQRELSVDVLDRDSDYAHAINEERSVNAENVRDIYQNVMFNNNQGINKVYELLNGTSLASADTADIVFELDIVNVDTTDPDHSKSDSFYCAGVYKDALVARLRTAGEFDTKGNPVDMNRIRSYSLTYEAGTFTVYPAEIESSRGYMRKTFDGTEQEFALTPTRIGLTGWEEIHKNEAGVVKFTYSRSINGPFSEDPIKIRNYNGNGEIIYYQVEAPNHKKTEVKSFVAYIDRLALDITIGQQDTVFYYGDNIPDSDGIVSALNITYVPRKSDFDEDKTPSDFVIDGKLQFLITSAGQKVTDRKIGAGLYTVSLEPVDTTVNSLDNYNITYTGRNGSGKDNENAFEISQRPLIVDWRQSGSNWLADGMHFVYNATTPGIQPTVRMYRNADLSIYNENSTGANTSDDNTEGTVENYVDGDNIVLRPQTLGGSTYNADGYPTEKTELSNPTYAKNYVLVNPTSRYYIDQRTVKINVFDQSATYGTAKSVAMGALISSKEAGANWEYNAGNDYEFIREHYNNWALTSEAIEGGATDYHDVKADGYPIVLSQREGNDGAVASNYNIIVYRKHKDGTVESEPSEHSNAAIFMIEKATLNLARREFNFDASPKNPDDPDDTTAKENCYLDVAEIRKIVKVVGATTQGQVSIMMSEPIQYGESGQVTGSAADYQLTNDRVIDIKTAGKYYVWIKMTNSNYEEFEGTLDVSYLTNWI